MKTALLVFLISLIVFVSTVYPNDKQMNYDGLIFHAPCSKCTDCGCNVTVSNFAINDEGGGKKELLCKVHYKARFTAAGGVYAGAGKFTKQSEREVVSAQRATINATGSSPVKAGTGLEKDTNYTLERSVTTPDKRPSLHMAASSSPKEKEGTRPKERGRSGEANVAQLQIPRSQRKSTREGHLLCGAEQQRLRRRRWRA